MIDNGLLKRRSIYFYILAFVISVSVNGGLKVLNVWLSPTEAVLRNLIFGTMIIQGGLLVFLITQIIGVASNNKISDRAMVLMATSAVYIAAGFLANGVANRISPPLKEQQYLAFLDENLFLVEAIEQYAISEGEPPERLEDLYPNYLVPSPFITLLEGGGEAQESELELGVPYASIDSDSAGRVTYQYRSPVDIDAERQDLWELSVTIYLGSFESVKFTYNPVQDYALVGGRIGDWAYSGAYD